ncbi:exodeoxyribonuclease V subunit alpha [Oxalobacter vibrioformis]|uniref:RecBCD enzyme subunit RecD n=1 Tax=Oxalobacter vibrioformis TaxID=933080 RepID=A0A9E9P377_9BURK|nr:exodeoxyribonuclease V subunit alpha [Oxalobacter vibrioformis]WAW09930.1 exodeoxyribonuclease V subunit alpha [Oxalobacter vibrioformis]
MAFHRTPAELLADAFSAYVTTWAKERDVDETAQDWLCGLAYWLSMAVSTGHVCLPLEEQPDFDRWPPIADVRALLFESGLVGTPDAPGNLPLILDAGNRLYLHRYFAYERTLARRIQALKTVMPVDTAAARLALDRFFGKAEAKTADWQRLAAALAMRGCLTIISGGPGTGKTTTVANILACLLSQQPAQRIMLAAPTGKAAMRMLEAIRAQTARFPADVQAKMPSEAFTLHRLLGMTSTAGVFRHHADNPLLVDTLVVDEASMIDLAMASHLFNALPAHARLIMLGDKDQLSAVEAGAVFSELSADPALTPACRADLADMTGIPAEAVTPPQALSDTGLADSTVWLNRNFRFTADSGISQLALAIRDGRITEAETALENAPDGSVTWLSRDTAAALPKGVITFLHENHAAYLDAVAQSPDDPQAVFAAFERFRVLCATREGAYGVSAVNTLMATYARGRLDIPPRQTWYTGRPVMIMENDYVLRLFNGDIGIVLPGENGTPMVFFPSDGGDFRAISPARLPAHETAFAMTVHKSQGSEFDALLILIPPYPTPLITRELLYTAVTRARRHVSLVCSEAVLENGILTSVKKHSGLVARLAEEAKKAPL